MNIYFARSLRGEKSANDQVIHSTIMKAIKGTGNKLSMNLTPVDQSVLESWPEYVYRRDLDWLDRSHCLIGEVSNVSHGVGYEIAYACHVVKIPILLLANEQRIAKISMMFSPFRCVAYADPSDLDAVIRHWIAATFPATIR